MRVVKNPFIWVPVLVAVLGLGWWLGSPLFITIRVDEPAPKVTVADGETSQTMAKDGMMKDGMAKNEMMKPMMLSGIFVDGDSLHKAAGKVSVLEAGEGKQVLRFEEFKVTNGPDLFVVLMPKDGRPSEGLRLGALKGSEGSQNYELPMGTDLMKLSRIVIWCRAFDVVFGTADLM